MSYNFSYSDDAQPYIPVFTGDHYDQWVEKMGEILYHCGLLSYVEYGSGTTNELMKERDGVALNYIRRGLSPRIRPLIEHTTKSKQAWDILYDVFGRNSEVHRKKKAPPQNSLGQGSSSIFTVSNAATAFVVMKEVADIVEAKNTISSEVENLSKKYGRYFKGSTNPKNESKDMGSTAVKLDNPYVDAGNGKGMRSTISNYGNPYVDAGNSKGKRSTIGNYDNPYVDVGKEHKSPDFNYESKPEYESIEPSNNFQNWGTSSSVSRRKLKRSSNKKQFTNHGNENHLMGCVLSFFLICFVTMLILSVIYLGKYYVT